MRTRGSHPESTVAIRAIILCNSHSYWKWRELKEMGKVWRMRALDTARNRDQGSGNRVEAAVEGAGCRGLDGVADSVRNAIRLRVSANEASA